MLEQRAGRRYDRARCGPGSTRKSGKGRPNAVMVCRAGLCQGHLAHTVADRRRNLTGFIVGIFDLPLLLQSIRASSPANPALAISVFPPESSEIGESPLQHATDASGGPPSKTAINWSASLSIGDADWLFQAAPASGGPIATHDRALALYAAGIVTTIFLAVYLALSGRNALQLALANRRVLELAQTDTLTGLANRAYFLERSSASMRRRKVDVCRLPARPRPLQERQRFARTRCRRRLVACRWRNA